MHGVAITSSRVDHRLEARRCRCACCGAHVMCVAGRATLGGRCSTCGSYELAPLEPVHLAREAGRADRVGYTAAVGHRSDGNA
jgi:hypothetical protein